MIEESLAGTTSEREAPSALARAPSSGRIEVETEDSRADVPLRGRVAPDGGHLPGFSARDRDHARTCLGRLVIGVPVRRVDGAPAIAVRVPAMTGAIRT
jgi:hypothetical protein